MARLHCNLAIDRVDPVLSSDATGLWPVTGGV